MLMYILLYYTLFEHVPQSHFGEFRLQVALHDLIKHLK